MNWLFVIGMGILFGLFGRISLPLSYFIAQIEDGTECNKCVNQHVCFARKKIPGMQSNYVDELTLFAFLRIRKQCAFVIKCNMQENVLYLAGNTILTGLLFWSMGSSLDTFLCCVSTAALLALSVVDWKTQYIPVEFNVIIILCGLIRIFADLSNWLEYAIGLFAVSGFLFLIDKISVPILRKRYAEKDMEIDRAIGDGDIKLMAATGLLLGWKLNFLALAIGCVAGSVIHLMLMMVKKGERQFALGPYLSLGVYITMICGRQLISWYIGIMGVNPL